MGVVLRCFGVVETSVAVEQCRVGAVELEVVECDPAVKGDTKTNATKTAKLSTGTTIDVPMFIAQGESLKIDTRTGSYVERVKK